ncbi:MAG: trigger factor [Boseongicola sp.]|nr:trigger factor [Boseongicola sp.]NNJ67489.1 trigger factor [Boseongicola sp.]
MSGLASLTALEGRWSMARRIVHDDGRCDLFEGESVFHRSGPRLIQDESGVLTPSRGGTSMKATRRYVWSADGSRIDVAFEDMRPFHSVPLGVEVYETTYLCPPDRYQVSYDFKGFPNWVAVWTVEGPRKAYRMETQFQRLS